MKKMNKLTLISAVLISLASISTAQTKPQMVLVEGGSYKMGNSGSIATLKGDKDEKPVHTVKVNDFYIGKYEVTVGEYKQFIQDASANDLINKRGEHKMPKQPDSTWLAEHPDTKKFYPLPTQRWWGWVDNLPMHHITWYEAAAYCNWLSEKEGLQKCYFENEDGTDPREKFRIRAYNCSKERISLELKQKERGKCHKVSCPMSLAMTEEIMAGKIPRIDSDTPYLIKKLICQMHSRALRPVVIVSYERVPLVYRAGNVRVTFDRNIRSSADIAGFFARDVPSRPILSVNTNMIEVKFDEFLPDFISEILQTTRLSQTSFSKYYLCRRYNMAAERL